VDDRFLYRAARTTVITCSNCLNNLSSQIKHEETKQSGPNSLNLTL